VADSQLQHERPAQPYRAWTGDASWMREADGMADDQCTRLGGRNKRPESPRVSDAATRCSEFDGLEQSDSRGRELGEEQHGDTLPSSPDRDSRGQHIDRSSGHLWTDFQLVSCRDGKTRRVPTEPAFFPLAYGVAERVVRLRGYGNAIVPQVAAEFIAACLEIGVGDRDVEM